MYALLLALVCLISAQATAAPLNASSPVAPQLDVYLQHSDPGAKAVLKQMGRELTQLMGPAGYRVIIHGFSSNGANRSISKGMTNRQNSVMVDLRGSCLVPPERLALADPLRMPQPLASSAVSDGKILPFTWIDCAALTRFLASPLASQPEESHDRMYGRAMARLLAHELYHVLTQAEDHATGGVAKARLSTTDLLADHFEFDQTALSKFHEADGEGAAPSETSSGEVSLGGR